MGFHTKFETTPSPIYGSSVGPWGLSEIGITGGEGTIAISAGGYVTAQKVNANTAAADPLPIPLFVRAVSGHPEELALGAHVPSDGVLWISGAWLIYWAVD